MPVTVIAGGQFGSEGKGKAAHFFAREKNATVAVRVGGSNSGHTVIDESGVALVFRHLPTAAILSETICVLGAGTYIDVDVLLAEVALVGLPADRLIIDPNAFIVTSEHKRIERAARLGSRIGSTQSGTGAAVIDRIRRLSAKHLASNEGRLAPYVRPIRPFLRSRLNRGEHIIVEGTQGFGLSLLHSRYFPKATSRDTTAAAFVAEAGLSPLDVQDVILVIRAFPIRVAGDSGPLPKEIDWQTIAREGGWDGSLTEHTSVTRKVRRVARFDPEIVRDAIEVNAPSQIVLNHADYLDARNSKEKNLTKATITTLRHIEQAIWQKIDWIGVGPKQIIRRPDEAIELLRA